MACKGSMGGPGRWGGAGEGEFKMDRRVQGGTEREVCEVCFSCAPFNSLLSLPCRRKPDARVEEGGWLRF